MIRTSRRVQPVSNLRSLYLFFERNTKIIAGFAATLFLMKILSLNEYGIYNLFLGTTVYFNLFTSFGFLASYKKLLPKFLYQQDYLRLNWLIKFISMFRTVGLFFTLGICYFLYQQQLIPANLNDYSTHFLLFGISAFFLLQTYVFRKVLEVAYLQKYLMTSDLVLIITKLTLTGFVFLAGFGLVEILLVDIVCNFALFALTFVYYLTTFKKPDFANYALQTSSSKTGIIKELFRGNKLHSLNEAAATLLSFATDFLIIVYFLGPASLAYYAFSVKISEFISQLLPFQKIKKIITPTMVAKFVESRDQKDLNDIFQILTKMSVFCVLPVLAVFSVWGNTIINIFDPKFLPAYETLLVVFIFTLISTLPFALPLQILEKPKPVITSKFILFLHVILSILFVQFWGTMGVALAALTTTLIKKCFEFLQTKKHANISLPRFELLQIFINCAVLGIIAFLLKPYISGFFTLCAFSVIILLIYLALSRINNAFKQNESQLLKNATLVTSLTF